MSMGRAAWHAALAGEIARLSSEGLDSGVIEVEIPLDCRLAFVRNINRTNLLEVCGASPRTLLVVGVRGDRSSAFASFEWRGAGRDTGGIAVYPPIIFDELGAGDG